MFYDYETAVDAKNYGDWNNAYIGTYALKGKYEI